MKKYTGLYKKTKEELSCPVCELGRVDSHRFFKSGLTSAICDRCGAEFCLKCHGLKNRISLNVSMCQYNAEID